MGHSKKENYQDLVQILKDSSNKEQIWTNDGDMKDVEFIRIRDQPAKWLQNQLLLLSEKK